MFLAALDATPPPRAGGPHPRLLFSEADLPALRARVNEAGSMRHEALELSKRGMDAYVVPVVNNAIEGQGKFGRENMAGAALLWLLTQDSKYLDKAKAILAQQMKAAPAYGATVLFDAQEYYTERSFILSGLALAYDWLYSALSADERKQLHDAIVGLGTEVYLHANTAWWATITTASNFTGNNGTGIGTAGLAVWGEENAAPQWVARATQLLRSYGQSGFDAAGAGNEGVLYGNYGLHNPAIFSHALERAGGPNPLREGNLAHHEEWFAYEVLPGGGALNPMNDARYEELDETYMSWASAHGANPSLAQWIQKQWRKPDVGPPNVDDLSSPSELLFYEEPPASFSPEQQLPLAKFFPGRGLVHVRSGFSDKNDFMAAFEARQTNVGQGVHQQADIGNFVLYAQGARFAIDSGYCNYVDAILAGNANAVRSCETKGHNAVEADGRSQDYLGRGTVRTYASTAAVGDPGALDVAVSDARTAYLLLSPARADRLFLHVRAEGSYPEYLVVSDAFRQDGLLQHDYASYLHTDKANQVATSGGGSAVSARISAPGGAVLSGTWVGAGLGIGVDQFVADYEGAGTHPRVIVSSKSVEYDAIGVLIPAPSGQSAPPVASISATGGVAGKVALDASTSDVVLERTSGDTVTAQGAKAVGAFAWLRLPSSGLPKRYALVEGTRLEVNGQAIASTNGKTGTIVVGAGAVAVSGKDVGAFRVAAGGAPSRVTLNGAVVNVRDCGQGVVVYPATASCTSLAE